MQEYGIGEPRQLTSTWYGSDGEGIEPSAIELTVTHPDGSTDVYDKTMLTQGDTVADWYRWVIPDALGVWRYNFVGTISGVPDVEQGGVFLVGEGSSTSPTGPCEPWTTWEDVEACNADALASVNPAQQELAIDLASELLYNLSGRVYSGVCTTTRSLCLSCLHCLPARCGCVPWNGIDLGIAAPVWGVWDVIDDGVTLPTTAYEVHDHRYLVRLDGQLWPTTGRSSSLTDPDHFRATWAYGRKVPLGGRYAAMLFAAEIAKLCTGQACAIPQRVTNVSREGMNFTILDSMTMIAEGRTGIALVDEWLVADRAGRKARPGWFSPMAVGSKVRQVRT